MYIVALGWIYVTLLMALTEPSIVAGVMTFVFYGLAPLAIFLYVFGRPRRRSVPVSDAAEHPDGENAKRDE